MTEKLVIVFVKNLKLGKVKTRLAKTIGDLGAFEVYTELVKVTEKATKQLETDVRVYFSDAIVASKWSHAKKAVQQGVDLGERMQNAFQKGFNDGYKHIVLIGSDLPEITEHHLRDGLQKLKHHDVVFGPAQDGGYYLIGLSEMHECIFKNKPWSQSNLLRETLDELHVKQAKIATLVTLNDIDTFDDLKASSFYQSNPKLQQRIHQLND
ncbi:TIGR04282 family arsenosugar biosynthesis glycosyltransferase [Tamlana fucoidanivorans]|uniref:Glycosyltransferase n=1 Tax=Allotamlana fucoidanivorans TaxID=2583814 RepID=A0A5C4SJK4_9FLAO|nr:TIGR04282 family arsenosugar biosynthesis glycosyltransferase [Tamlana fucoidanivorans]TNJ43834.1 glycosyltransferase [Tamlana fucoidanivorans]